MYVCIYIYLCTCIYIYIYMYIYSIKRMCVCVCPWRLALQKEGRRQQMDEIWAVRTVEQLLFALSWLQKWGQKPAPKTGPQYCRKKERLPKWRSAPSACSETPEPFVCFPGIGLDKASSKFHIEGNFICGCGSKSGPWRQRRLSTSRLTAKRILHYRSVRKPIATDYDWEGVWLENRQGV